MARTETAVSKLPKVLAKHDLDPADVKGIRQRAYDDGRVIYSLRRRVGGEWDTFEHPDLDTVVAEKKNFERVSPKIRSEIKPSRPIDQVFAEVLCNWLVNDRRKATGEKNLNHSTVNGYWKSFKYHIIPWAEEHGWKTLTVSYDDFVELLDTYGEDGSKQYGTYTSVCKALQVLGRSLVELRFRADNPAIDPASIATGDPKRLDCQPTRRSVKTVRTRQHLLERSGSGVWLPTWDEIVTIVSGIDSRLHQLWFYTLALTGLRPHEAVGLWWDRDIFLDTGEPYLRTNYPQVEVAGYRRVLDVDLNDPVAGEKIEEAKLNEKRAGKTGARTVPIADELLPVFDELKDYRLPQPAAGWLFPGRLTAKALDSVYGSFPISYEAAGTAFRHRVNDVGFEGLRQYDLRHFFASRKLGQGEALATVAAYMGDLTSTVEKTYRHLTADELKKRAAEPVEVPPA